MEKILRIIREEMNAIGGQEITMPVILPAELWQQSGRWYEIKDEPVTTEYKRGTVAMARTSAPDSVGSQFFIVLDDAAGDILASYNTYQIIGEVTASAAEQSQGIVQINDAVSQLDQMTQQNAALVEQSAAAAASLDAQMRYLVDAGYLAGNPLGLIRQRRRKMSAEAAGPLRAVASPLWC